MPCFECIGSDRTSSTPPFGSRAFFESETAKERILTLFPEWEINTAFKHEDCWVVTLTGSLIRASGRRVPFMAMISTEEAVEEYAARSG